MFGMAKQKEEKSTNDKPIKAYIEPHQADEYNTLLREKMFALKDTGISSRVFNLWKKVGLVDTPLSSAEHGWIKFSFSDYIWLKIIQDLRSFGCSLADIRNAKKLLMSTGFFDNENLTRIGTDKTAIEEFLADVEKQINLKFFGKSLDDLRNSIREREVYEALLDSMVKPLNNLEMTVLHMLAGKKDAYLLFTPGLSSSQNQALKFPDKGLRGEKQTGKSKSFALLNVTLAMDTFPRVSPEIPHLKISLRHYIKQFIADESKEKQLEYIRVLSKDEIELLKQIRQGKATEITVKLIDNKIDRIEVTKDLKKDAEARIIETFTSNEYSDIAYKVENGKIVSFKKTTKIKSRKN